MLWEVPWAVPSSLLRKPEGSTGVLWRRSGAGLYLRVARQYGLDQCSLPGSGGALIQVDVAGQKRRCSTSRETSRPSLLP